MKVLTGILIFMMMLTGSFIETEASSYWTFDTSFNNGYGIYYLTGQPFTYSTDDVTYSYLYSESFHQTTSGLAVYDYDTGSMGDGVFPDGYYRLGTTYIGSSENARYHYIGNLEFDTRLYYYQFELVRTSNGLSLLWHDIETNDPKYQDSSGNSVDVVLTGINLDNWYVVMYNGLYESGFFDSGYNQGREDFGYDDNGNYLDAITYGQQQYQAGVSQGAGDTLSLQNMIPGVLGVFIAFFFQVMSISVLGVSILDLIVLMFGVAVVLLLFKTFIK